MADYFLNLLNPKSPSNPEPSRSMVEGSGTAVVVDTESDVMVPFAVHCPEPLPSSKQMLSLPAPGSTDGRMLSWKNVPLKFARLSESGRSVPESAVADESVSVNCVCTWEMLAGSDVVTYPACEEKKS